MKRGLGVKPWVKTSLAPGSQVVTDYLAKAGLQKDLDALGFNLVGYGCTTCIGNSGPLPEEISQTIHEKRPGGRRRAVGQPQFRRPRQSRRAGQLSRLAAAGGGLCAGRHRVNVDLTSEPLGIGTDGQPVYLKDIWPIGEEIAKPVRKAVTPDMFSEALRRRVRRRSGMAQDRGEGRAHLRLERALHLCAEPALFRGHVADAGAGHRCRATRASSACSSTPSPPTTSRPPARSSATARPATT